MILGKAAGLGVGGLALALAAVSGIASAPAPDDLPTVTVWHSPT